MAVRPPDYLDRLQRAAEMVRGGMTQTEAARECGVAQGNLSLFLRGKYVQREPPPKTETPKQLLDRLRAECADVVRRAYAGVTTNCAIPAKFPCRVIFLDDLHVPFTDWEIIERVIEREAGADYLVSHEIINFDGFARFDQTYLSDPDAEERTALALLERLRQHFGTVVCGTSNHMQRPEKLIARALRPEQQEYVLQRLRTVFEGIASLGIIQIASPILQIGDAIFGHYDRSLITPGATPARMRARVAAYDDVFGWNANVRAVFTGHTHRVTMTPFRGGRGYQYEVGCSTFLPPYALDHARGGPWSEIRMACGYGLAEFDSDGRIDLTESRAVHLGWARLPR